MNTLPPAVYKKGLEETYDEFKKWLATNVKQFQRNYGGELEELYQEACLLFIQAYNTYSYEKGSLTTWIYWKVWGGLLDDLKKEMPRRKKWYKGEVDFDQVKHKFHFDFNRFMEMLSDDAFNVVMLAVESPKEIAEWMGIEQRYAPVKFKDIYSLKSFLVDIGWTWTRVQETIQEIREMLQ